MHSTSQIASQLQVSFDHPPHPLLQVSPAKYTGRGPGTTLDDVCCLVLSRAHGSISSSTHSSDTSVCARWQIVPGPQSGNRSALLRYTRFRYTRPIFLGFAFSTHDSGARVTELPSYTVQYSGTVHRGRISPANKLFAAFFIMASASHLSTGIVKDSQLSFSDMPEPHCLTLNFLTDQCLDPGRSVCQSKDLNSTWARRFVGFLGNLILVSLWGKMPTVRNAWSALPLTSKVYWEGIGGG